MEHVAQLTAKWPRPAVGSPSFHRPLSPHVCHGVGERSVPLIIRSHLTSLQSCQNLDQVPEIPKIVLSHKHLPLKILLSYYFLSIFSLKKITSFICFLFLPFKNISKWLSNASASNSQSAQPPFPRLQSEYPLEYKAIRKCGTHGQESREPGPRRKIHTNEPYRDEHFHLTRWALLLIRTSSLCGAHWDEWRR